jgi:hypothetical protein
MVVADALAWQAPDANVPFAPADTGVNVADEGSLALVTVSGVEVERLTLGVPVMLTLQGPLCCAFTDGVFTTFTLGVPVILTVPVTAELIVPVTGSGVFSTLTGTGGGGGGGGPATAKLDRTIAQNSTPSFKGTRLLTSFMMLLL